MAVSAAALFDEACRSGRYREWVPAMLPIPPLASSAIGATAVQRQAEEKIHQQQRTQARSKETAAAGDRFEHAVESSEAIQPIHDDERAKQQKKKDPKRRPLPFELPEEGENHLDLKA
jgi:hypothetical protein